MSRGGDRRPIDRSHGRDLSYAYLLLNAMCEDVSEAGRRFNREREAIFVRWERLLRVLSNHNGDKLGNVAGVPFRGSDPLPDACWQPNSSWEKRE